MTLQKKFAVLIGLLSLTAAVSLGGAIWSVGLLDREVARPFTATAALDRDLRDARSSIENLINTLNSATSSDELAMRAAAVAFTAEQLGDLDYGAVRLGLRSARILRASAAEAQAAALAWEATPSAENRRLARERASAHLALLRRLESQTAGSADLAAEHVADVRRGILLVQVVAVVTALLAALLALSVHRRWIVEPVGRLRAAAERLGTGDLDHRVPEGGSDELALLGREVNHMAATVKRMQDEAVERERFAAVGQVVRRLAHNIRNPLAGIRGLAETTLDDLPENAEEREAQQRIIATVDRFESWLSGFLRATSPNEIVPTQGNPAEWLDAALAALRPMAESAGVTIELNAQDAPASAWFDAVQLEQALVAVVTNAVEATPAGGTVAVNASSNGAEWALTVADDGPGVTPGDENRIFEPDYTTKPGGHGIGLTSARWIVRSHGGMMSAQNAENASGRTGAIFDVRLPIGRRQGHDDGEVDRAEHPDR